MNNAYQELDYSNISSRNINKKQSKFDEIKINSKYSNVKKLFAIFFVACIFTLAYICISRAFKIINLNKIIERNKNIIKKKESETCDKSDYLEDMGTLSMNSCNEINEIEENMNNLKEEEKNYQSVNKELEKEINTLNKEIRKLNEKLANADNVKWLLENEIEEIKKEIETLREKSM